MVETRLTVGSCALLLLVLIILVNGNFWSEGRLLVLVNIEKNSTTNIDPEVKTASRMVVVEDFRPTTPGHSPGIGHAN
ncbi:hypothetical protein ACJIZ3_002588 [Penstemon smallii]|uniref:Transmembrane protein n=1 Tax=Penstemon smallii TaxID=265156 RepID=A0ABD3U9T6_9LAMI